MKKPLLLIIFGVISSVGVYASECSDNLRRAKIEDGDRIMRIMQGIDPLPEGWRTVSYDSFQDIPKGRTKGAVHRLIDRILAATEDSYDFQMELDYPELNSDGIRLLLNQQGYTMGYQVGLLQNMRIFNYNEGRHSRGTQTYYLDGYFKTNAQFVGRDDTSDSELRWRPY